MPCSKTSYDFFVTFSPFWMSSYGIFLLHFGLCRKGNMIFDVFLLFALSLNWITNVKALLSKTNLTSQEKHLKKMRKKWIEQSWNLLLSLLPVKWFLDTFFSCLGYFFCPKLINNTLIPSTFITNLLMSYRFLELINLTHRPLTLHILIFFPMSSPSSSGDLTMREISVP